MSDPIAVTQGDPAGVGPELCLRLLQEDSAHDYQIIGCAKLLKRVADHTGLPFHPDRIIDLPLEANESIQPGQLSADAGRHSFQCLDAAVESCLEGKHRAVVTNPINKESWHLAGIDYPGHTEYLVEKTKTNEHAMMLTSEEITCSLVTTHVALIEVPQLLTPERILEVIRLTHQAMKQIRDREPRLVMPGLNPHAGENGLFGKEEIEILQPTLEQARLEGIQIDGPVSPDTAFTSFVRQNTDAYVCLYHDQGLIPLKTLAFDIGVNITLGLPIVRTSVDHGTAFDIAWQGKASSRSLHEAIALARKLS